MKQERFLTGSLFPPKISVTQTELISSDRKFREDKRNLIYPTENFGKTKETHFIRPKISVSQKGLILSSRKFR